MRKKIISLFIIVMLSFGMMFSVACKNGEDDPNILPPSGEETVCISETSLDMLVGEVKSLTLINVEEGMVIDWVSSDETVATVSHGEITGVGYGNAVVTAIVGDQMLSCSVTVGFAYQSVPVLKLKNEILTDGIYCFRLYVGDSYEIMPVLTVETEEKSVEFTLTAKSNAVSIDGRTITAVSATEKAEILVGCVYEGKTYTLQIEIAVDEKEG